MGVAPTPLKPPITLIKGLLTDRKLEIIEHFQERAFEKLSNYNIEDDNWFINSLYLALNYQLDSVVISNVFPALPTYNKVLNFEEMPLNELVTYCMSPTCDRLIAHQVYMSRLEEEDKLTQLSPKA